MTTIITGAENISHFQRLAQLGAMRLELKGLRHSSGRSVIAMIKRNYNLKGSKQTVVAEFAKIVEEKRPRTKYDQAFEFCSRVVALCNEMGLKNGGGCEQDSHWYKNECCFYIEPHDDGTVLWLIAECTDVNTTPDSDINHVPQTVVPYSDINNAELANDVIATMRVCIRTSMLKEFPGI